MSTADQAPADTTAPRWLRLALLASLALNVLMIGAVATYAMRMPERGYGAVRQIEWILMMVPEDRQEFTRQHFAAEHDALMAIRRKRRAMMAAIIEAIRAEPFNPAELNAALEIWRNGSMARRKIVHDSLVRLLESFDPDERLMFADRLDERVRQWQADQVAQAGE